MSKLNNTELQKALDVMNQSNQSNLAQSVKSANDLIIKALYQANVDYSTAAKFIYHNLGFYGPLHIKEAEQKHVVSKADVKRWQGTIDLVASNAVSVCNE